MWDGVVRLRSITVGALAARHGGRVLVGADRVVERIVPVEAAGPGDLAPVLAARFARAGAEAGARGASLLVDESAAARFQPVPGSGAVWVCARATWTMAAVLDDAVAPDEPPACGEGTSLAEHVVLGPRVVLGRRVRIGASSVIGRPGFGWATDEKGRVRAVPQLGGVVIEDDVDVGPLCTIDAGTLAPTRIRRGTKIDAQCHIGHNCDVGEGTFIAAQTGLAGSVRIGKCVLLGGQVGIGDHVTVGDGARVAGKSGVIGDVPAGAVVAGYPAVPRVRWLRAAARNPRGR
jgi:UDP-3-O-[3-hydroxymyristoyl] glucosamine N-acyltransferase